MGLLDGLRGGQALVNMYDFGPGIQLPDDSRMYQLGAAKMSQTKQPQSNQEKKDAYKAPYMTRASQEALTMNNDLEREESSFVSKWTSKYNENEGLSQMEFYNKYQDEIDNDILRIRDKKIQLKAIDQRELKNLEIANNILSDQASETMIAKDKFGNYNFRLQVRDDKDNILSTEVKTDPHTYAGFIGLQRKVKSSTGQEITLTDSEREIAKTVLSDVLNPDATDEDIATALRNVATNRITTREYVINQDSNKPLGEFLDQGGYLSQENMQGIIRNRETMISSVGSKSNKWNEISQDMINRIVTGEGGVYTTALQKSNYEEIENTLNNYVLNGMTSQDRHVWSSEYISAIENGESLVVANKAGELVRTPISDIPLETYIKSKLIPHAKFEKTTERDINMRTESGGVGQARENLKTNWWHQLYTGSPKVGSTQELISTAAFGDFKLEGSQFEGIFRDTYNEFIEFAKESGEEVNKDLIQKANEVALENIRNGIEGGYIKTDPTFWQNMRLMIENIDAGGGDKRGALDRRNALENKNKESLLRLLDNTDFIKEAAMYMVNSTIIPANERNNMDYALQGLNNNSALSVRGHKITVDELNKAVPGSTFRLAKPEEDNRPATHIHGGGEGAKIQGVWIVQNPNMNVKKFEEILEEKGISKQAIKDLGITPYQVKIGGELKDMGIKVRGLADYTTNALNTDINYNAYKNIAGAKVLPGDMPNNVAVGESE